MAAARCPPNASDETSLETEVDRLRRKPEETGEIGDFEKCLLVERSVEVYHQSKTPLALRITVHGQTIKRATPLRRGLGRECQGDSKLLDED